MDYQEQLALLRLIRSKNVGNKTVRKLHSKAGSAVKALRLLSDRLPPHIELCPAKKAEEELSALQEFGAELLCFTDPDYPFLLNMIDDAPVLLTMKGNRALLSRKMVALVGSRHASRHSLELTYTLANHLSKHASLIVVSGLARGIDKQAHDGSKAYGTIGVIGCGIDQIYPKEHTTLYHEMMHSETGLVITEQPFGEPPKAEYFPRRNRIISGLSLGVVVIEAALKSGSLITAHMALEHGREVFAVPGFPLDPGCQGSNQLLKNGAHLVESAHDILAVFSDLPFMDNAMTVNQAPNQPEIGDKIRATRAPPPGQQVRQPNQNSAEPLSDVEQAICQHLSMYPISLDQLIDALPYPSEVIIRSVSGLEMKGKIYQPSFNQLCLVLTESSHRVVDA